MLLDWAYAGVGAIGEDPGNLVPDSVFDHFIPAAEMPDLEQAVFEGYLAGLREAGWDDDPRLARLGMWSSAVKYDWLAAFTLSQVSLERQYRHGGGGEVGAGFKFQERSRALLFNAGWARQALDLADDLGLLGGQPGPLGLAERHRLVRRAIPAHRDHPRLRGHLSGLGQDRLAGGQAGGPQPLRLDPHSHPPVVTADLGPQVDLDPDHHVQRVTAQRRGVEGVPETARKLLKDKRRWEVRSAGTGSKGERWYAWAWIATASPRHHLLVRRHLKTGELAFHYCFVPEGQLLTKTRLIRAAEDAAGDADDAAGVREVDVILGAIDAENIR